jgi:hypothetical protein
MAADDRKRRIMEHLTKSLDGVKSISPKKTTEPTTASVPPPPPPKPTPEAVPKASKPKASERRRKIMDHVARSSVNFGNFSLDEKERKQQIIEHVRKTQK